MKQLIKFVTILLSCYTQFLWCKQPITLFCHGIIDNKTQIERYDNFIEQPAQSFNFPDAQQPYDWDLNTLIFNGCLLFGKPVNRNQMFMATNQDITTLKQQINPKESYMLYGFSRGGSTTINYLAEYNPKNIKALILEATPADMIDAVNHAQYDLGYQFASDRRTQEQIFHSIFPAYQLGSTPPVKNIAFITNKDLPILIIHAINDKRVPIDAAYKLYLAFLDNGFPHVYLYELPDGQHAHYTTGIYKNSYLQVLHSFYKKYGFTYNENFADFHDMIRFQPTKKEISKKLELFHDQQITKFLAQKSLNLKYVATFTTAGLVALNVNWYLNRTKVKNHNFL